MNRKYKRIGLITIRIILGGVFLLSGLGKLIDSSDARYLVELLATKYYVLIEYATPIITTVSIIELLLAVFLLWGKRIKITLAASFLLILGFTIIFGYFFLEGQQIASCGCFGAFGLSTSLDITLLRNIILMILIVTGFVFSFTPSESPAFSETEA